jgi:hypothetical protein|tara:strand:- start:174 stop:443 length:270 start_codon:yes stop_codon:yes gene_type:complete
MLQNDMKKGQTGTTKDGYKFRIEDNKRGNIRDITIYGVLTKYSEDRGSIYTSDIATVDMPDGTTERLEQTPKQAKQSQYVAQLNKALFG